MTQPQAKRATLACGVMIASVLVIAPNFDIFPGLSHHDAKRLMQIVLVGALTIALLVSRPLRAAWLASFSTLPAAARWAIGLVLAGGVVSALVAHAGTVRLPYSLAEVALITATLGIAFLVAAVLRQYSDTGSQAIMAIIAVAIGLYLFRFLSRYSVAVSLDDPVFVDALYANFSHIRFFAQWVSWTLPLIVVLPLFIEQRRLRQLSYAIAPLWWALLFVSGTRATMLAMAAAIVAVPLLAGRPGQRWLRLQLLGAAAGAVCYLLGFRFVATLHSGTGLGRLAAGHSSGRLTMWSDAWRMITEHPLLGGGPQSYAFSLEYLGSHPHSTPLQWAAEWGLPSLAAVTVLVGAALIGWLRFARREYAGRDDSEALLATALTGSVLAAAGHGLLSGIIVMPLSQLYLAVISGWMLFLYRRSEQPLLQLALHRHIALTLLAMLTFLSLLHLAVKDVPVLPQITAAYEAEYGTLRPRFWQHGRAPVYPPRSEHP